MQKYHVKVIPRASKNQVTVCDAKSLKVKLTSPPLDGKANEHLVEILADHFGVKKSRIHLLSGASSRHKIIEVSD